MKRVFVLIAALLLVSLYTHAQDEKVKIQSVVINFFDGLSKLNSDEIKANCTADFVLLENGKVWNTDSLINFIAPLKTMNFKRANTLKFISTDQNNEVAWVSYYNTADITLNAQQMNLKWLESAVLIKEKDGWKIKLLHSTVIK